ncbi:hypothetical protein CHUV2995_02619 [Corynebacterium diphtheriae subsp. lausannense]|nr:hypothetical protein CHUV2995_02619 [Corynebacterium diphtheriae subsp. lausannense]
MSSLSDLGFNLPFLVDGILFSFVQFFEGLLSSGQMIPV